MDTKNLKREELDELLKSLKLYQDLKKKLGKRGQSLFKRNLTGKSLLVVEHFSSVSDELAYDTAKTVYKKVFDITPEKEEIQFVINDTISGGVKVYKDDSMVDLSFSKVEGLMKK